MYSYDKKLVNNAKILRKNMTPQEKRLWYDFLKKLPITVRRQKNIGSYIVDFYIASARLVIELDGSQHLRLENRCADQERTAFLQKLGITVVRYSNLDVDQRFDDVKNDLLRRLGLMPDN